MRRRDLLRLVGVAGVGGVAGCGETRTGDPPPSPATSTTTEPPATRTPIPPDASAPTIVDYEAVPARNASRLAVRLVGEDDAEIAVARIRYGESTVEKRPDAKTVELDGTLDDVLQQRPEDLGVVHFYLEDEAGNAVEEAMRPDETEPDIAQYVARPTETAGEISLRLAGADDSGLRTLIAGVGNREATVDVRGQSTFDLTRTITTDTTGLGDAIVPGYMHETSAGIEDWAGNESFEERNTYVRKYDTLGNPRMAVNATYIPFGGSKFGECGLGDRSPAIVDRYTTANAGVVNRQIDQMQGHGITSFKFNFNGKGTARDQFEAMMDHELAGQFTMEPMYIIINKMKWGVRNDWNVEEVVMDDLGYIREEMLRRDNVNEIDGRPVVTLWQMKGVTFKDDVLDKVQEIWGGIEGLVETIRSTLTVGGTDPYLIANYAAAMLGGFSDPDRERVRLFDAFTNWNGPLREGKNTWADHLETKEGMYRNGRSFAEETDTEFYPTVFPGYDNRTNTCWGHDQYLPRSPERFRQLLDMAETYTTGDRVHIQSFNEWPEGHAIEPGTIHGDSYGTAYLEVIEEFQRGGPDG